VNQISKELKYLEKLSKTDLLYLLSEMEEDLNSMENEEKKIREQLTAEQKKCAALTERNDILSEKNDRLVMQLRQSNASLVKWGDYFFNSGMPESSKKINTYKPDGTIILTKEHAKKLIALLKRFNEQQRKSEKEDGLQHG